MKLQAPRGTKDLIGRPSQVFRWIDQKAWEVAQRFNYQEISTPIIESTDVFKRSLGETTDIINKEMYTFDDRGGDSITLRPEGTAGVARAFIQAGMYREVPLRFYYKGPMFRYERPQKGRQRQFHQLGAEVLGSESYLTDIEVISYAALFLDSIGLKNNVRLEINTLGDRESRTAYRENLIQHFEKYKDQLSEDSLNRLQANPLRILDSKDEKDQEAIAAAPKFSDSLNENSKNFFAGVLKGLDDIGITYTHNEKLVRGLDYYCHTVFEFVTDDLGAQNAVLAGGRYDGLVEALGGKSTQGIGWAAGIERLALLCEETAPNNEKMKVALIPLGDQAQVRAVAIAHQLRQQGVQVHTFYSGTNMGKLMKKADKIGAQKALILGEDELNRDEVTMKDFASGEQSTHSTADIACVLLGQ